MPIAVTAGKSELYFMSSVQKVFKYLSVMYGSEEAAWRSPAALYSIWQLSVEQNMCFPELWSITISITVGHFVTKTLHPLSYYPATHTVHNEQLYILGLRDLLSKSKELEIVQRSTESW